VLALFLALAATSSTGGVVVVTAAPPVDAARLAETLRPYLDDSAVEVRVAPAAAPGDLRAQLAQLRATGVDLRAIAAVQVAQSGRTLEVQLVDLVSDKTLVASVPPVAHEADRYRVLALKIHGLLRSALYEAVLTSTAPPVVERLVSPPAPVPERRQVLLWDTAYALVAFPLDGLVLQGVHVRGVWAPRPWLGLGLGSRALVPAQLQHDDVAISVARIPIALSADLRRDGRRLGASLGLVTELAVERVKARAEGDATRAHTRLVPSMGLEGEGRVRLARAAALFVRAAALAVLSAERYTVRGAPVVDPSRWQVGVDAGLSLGVW